MDFKSLTSRLILSSALVLGAIGPPIAALAASEAEPPPCQDSANTYEQNQCLSRVVEAVDKDIASQVARIAAKLRSQDARAPLIRLAAPFVAAQSKWQQFREAECAFRSFTFGAGTGAPAEEMFCRIELGHTRLNYLKGL